MIQSPFLEEVHVCKGIMKKLRKKIYKFNINKPSKAVKEDSKIRDALTVLQRRNVPQFVRVELQKYSDLTFASLSGFCLKDFKPVSEISLLTKMQEQEILEMYQKNKKTLRKRKQPTMLLKLSKRRTTAQQSVHSSISSTNISDIFDENQVNESSSMESNSCESDDLFGTLGNSNSLDQDYHNSDAMFQSTMLDFGNEIEMDSEEFLFKY